MEKEEYHTMQANKMGKKGEDREVKQITDRNEKWCKEGVKTDQPGESTVCSIRH